MSLMAWLKRKRYSAKVLATGPIAYWPLGDGSGSVATDLSGNGRHGAYSGVTLGQLGIGDRNTCPLFDGVNDYVDVYSASLAGAFNGAAGSLLAWAYLSAAAWADNAYRKIVYLAPSNDSEFVTVQKHGGTNSLAWHYLAGGVSRAYTPAVLQPTSWFCMAQTWSKSLDQFTTWLDGVQVGTALTGLGTWATSLGATRCHIGCQLDTPSSPFVGSLAHVALWNRPLSAAEMLNLGRLR